MLESRTDFCILGSGFAASLLAWVLARAGRSVTMVDRASHPRFAIGESSTPLADFLLEQIADEFNLPEVRPLCRWGTWQAHYPELRAGKKRGFSYYQHVEGQPFTDDRQHSHSYLVAASASDEVSDTHWMRSDVDAWLASQARQSGVSLIERFDVQKIIPSNSGWLIEGQSTLATAPQPFQVHADFLVDATGQAARLAGELKLEDHTHFLSTQNAALFGHFQGVAAMTKESRRWAGEESNNPFNGDDAAQHHMLADGRWIWMLRFRDGTTSVGLNGPSHLFPDAQTPDRAWQHWSQTLQKYPTLDALTTNATLVNPTQDGVPQLAWMPRVGRLRHYMYAAAQPGNWAMLPSAVGIVDPLHSTGIAHSLSGVQRLARILLSPAESQPIKLHAYARDAYAEVRWIDRLIGLCYRAERLSFSGFVAACSFYFLAAIHCERQMALGNTMPMGFLMHRSPDFCARLQQARSLLETLTQQQGHGCTGNEQRSAIEFVNYVRTALRPWNDVGLMDPSSRNRIARSSADK